MTTYYIDNHLLYYTDWSHLVPEATTGSGFFLKKLLLNNLQYSQENTCVESLFIKVYQNAYFKEHQ